jgi:hypothetical protein
MTTHLRQFLFFSGALAQLAFAHADNLNFPPSAELHYSIQARQSGIGVSGDASVDWQVSAQKYSVHAETHAMIIGKILDNRSSGNIDSFGLAPDQFVEKRFRKNESTTTFDRAGKTIRFSESDTRYTIKGGEQDRASAVWQLIALLRASGDTVKPGTEWKFLVAGRHDADPWTFKVLGKENTQTGIGMLATIHILKAPPADSKEQQLDIWLAPALEWYPVRLKFTDADQSYVDQVLDKLKP